MSINTFGGVVDPHDHLHVILGVPLLGVRPIKRGGEGSLLSLPIVLMVVIKLEWDGGYLADPCLQLVVDPLQSEIMGEAELQCAPL